jgi:hypothetical protein
MLDRVPYVALFYVVGVRDALVLPTGIRKAPALLLTSIQNFWLIADIVTYLVGVAEKEPSDFSSNRGSS